MDLSSSIGMAGIVSFLGCDLVGVNVPFKEGRSWNFFSGEPKGELVLISVGDLSVIEFRDCSPNEVELRNGLSLFLLGVLRIALRP